MQLSDAVRNNRLDSIETTCGASPFLQLRSGAAPANCAAAASGTLLAELALPADWLAAASGGSKAKSGTWSGVGLAGGTIAHYRVVDNAKTTCHAQGPVTATGGGGEMTVDNPVIAVDQAITVNTFTINDPNG